MGGPSAAQHAHHGSGMQAKSPTDVKTGIDSLGCQCGCSCISAGCASSGSGIASLNPTGFFETAPTVFPLHEYPASLRTAHGIELIRPPSKS